MSLLCGFTTAFLHCFILSAISWLFFEGFQLYVTLTTDDMLLEVENSAKIIWYYLLSYGLSLTIVAISLAVDPSSYTQSDFCVLMESNALFYTTFVAPIFLFIVGAIGYTILACYILCKKNKKTLKNKEHSRLTSVRFDLRCSFIFLIILSADWLFAYFYLRKAKLEEDVSNTYGYVFISFNSLLGLYIFIFHCIQNEKIRREYRKYVRQNSWLPKCLRCSKTSSISSSASHNQNQHYGTAVSKKSPIALPVESTTEGIPAGTPKSSAPPYPEVSGTCPGTVQHLQNPGVGSVSRNHRHNIILERAAGGTLRTPSGGHTSPTSSAGSTHLIFNSTQNDQGHDWNYQQPDQYFPSNQTATLGNDITNKNLNTYDDKFLYYDCKSKRLKQHPTNLRNLPQTPHQQHEYFYWTEKNNRKKNNGDVKNLKTDTVHAFYPSYKKTMIKHFPSGADEDKMSDSDFPEMENERKYFRYPPKQQQQHQHSSDEDHAESHLIHSGASSSHPSDCFPQDLPSYRQHYRHKHPSCDLSNEFACSIPSATSYYNQSSGPDEPVYEEILNSQMSEMCDEDDDDDDPNDIIMEEERYNRLRRMIANKEDGIRQPFSRQLNKGSFDFNPSKCYRKSPTSLSNSTIDDNTPSHRQHQQQQIVGRNISAMLDENNTVVCYLEPLPK